MRALGKRSEFGVILCRGLTSPTDHESGLLFCGAGRRLGERSDPDGNYKHGQNAFHSLSFQRSTAPMVGRF